MTTDKIRLEGMVFYGFHGTSPHEQQLGQRFVVDVEVYSDLQTAGLSDNLRDTTNYSQIHQLVKEIVEGPPRKLLESLAETIAQQMLETFKIDAARITIKKPGVAIKGSILDHASVDIFRER